MDINTGGSIRLSEDIKPIRYVKANTGKVLERVNTYGPMVITQNGEAAAVLMGVKDYDSLQESLALLRSEPKRHTAYTREYLGWGVFALMAR
ncbi:type II toxin-antitoxin system Phd/YefM family antitoxin [Desulfovibrio sp. OttesenSCG-928-C14]|nr:type II toxin-antitoxin system Phd/YefM family antitoxin [Desulfovibrio sp. OttesenSCG-928-C14]